MKFGEKQKIFNPHSNQILFLLIYLYLNYTKGLFQSPSKGRLTVETSATWTLYGGQFTLSSQVIKPNYLAIFPTNPELIFLFLTLLFILPMYRNESSITPSRLGSFLSKATNITVYKFTNLVYSSSFIPTSLS